MAAVDKIEDQRKPEDFIGHRNRKPVVLSAKGGNYISKSNNSSSSLKFVDFASPHLFGLGSAHSVFASQTSKTFNAYALINKNFSMLKLSPT